MLDTFLAIVGAMLSALPYTVVLFFIPGCAPCCGTPCIYCSSGAPPQLQVVISGVADANCGNCDGINGTYVLNNAGGAGTNDPCGGIGSACRWGIANTFTFTTCADRFSPHPGITAILSQLGGDYIMEVIPCSQSIFGGAFTADVGFRKNHGTTIPDCSTYSATDIPHSTAKENGNCSGAAATCLMTSL